MSATAAAALQERAPRLIRVRPKEEVVAAVDIDGTALYKSSCPSGGTIELFVEPMRRAHRIIEYSDTGLADNTDVFAVPAGHYFAMGDNRDNSLDSRADVGFVPAENLVGRAEIIFFSTDGSARWFEFWKWPTSIRFERIFGRVR